MGASSHVAPTARAWRAFYARERDELGEAGLLARLDRAPAVAVPAGAALIFPHTRLGDSGHLVGAVARSVVASGCDRVLALGVLHGGREADADAVARARAGDPDARRALRRVHGPGLPGDAGQWREEFSLDGFGALVELAARRAGRRAPEVIQRYPFLVGDDPGSLPGLDELQAVVASGAAVVATTDPVHYGVGYGQPDADLARDDPRAVNVARTSVERALGLLSAGDYAGFAAHAAAARSDFRDVGPVLAALQGPPLDALVHDLVLVGYADVLGVAEPTWVAGALATLERRSVCDAADRLPSVAVTPSRL